MDSMIDRGFERGRKTVGLNSGESNINIKFSKFTTKVFPSVERSRKIKRLWKQFVDI